MASRQTTAAILTWVPAIGFGLPAVYGARYLSRNGEIWHLMRFPAYGDGPFERVGIRTTVPLLLGFASVCAAEATVGWALWSRRPGSARLAMALLPFELVFWVGFALPGGPILGLARTAVLTFGRAGSPLRRRNGDTTIGERSRHG